MIYQDNIAREGGEKNWILLNQCNDSPSFCIFIKQDSRIHKEISTVANYHDQMMQLHPDQKCAKIKLWLPGFFFKFNSLQFFQLMRFPSPQFFTSRTEIREAMNWEQFPSWLRIIMADISSHAISSYCIKSPLGSCSWVRENQSTWE